MNFLSRLMINNFSFGIVIFVLASGFGLAQIKSSSKEQVLARLPVKTAWVENYEQAVPDNSPSATAPPSIVSVTIVRNGVLRREITLWSNKAQSEKWIINNIIFTQSPGSDRFAISSAEAAGIDPKYPDFPEFVWIDKEHFQAMEDKNGQKCLLYAWSDTGRDLRPVDSPIPIEPTKVWVSVSSKLPVALEDEHVKVTFNYDAPIESLTLPAQCRAMLVELDKTRKRLQSQQMVRP